MTRFETAKHFYYYCRKVIANNIGIPSREVLIDEEPLQGLYSMSKDLSYQIRSKGGINPLLLFTKVLSRGIKKQEDISKVNEYADYFIAVYIDFLTCPNDKISKDKRFQAILIGEQYIILPGKEYLSEEAYQEMVSIANTHGVYFLYDSEKQLCYIGKSIVLGERIPTSKHERNASYYNYAITKTKADIGIYEAYYIAKYKPYLNKEGITDDETTLQLPELKFTEIRSFTEHKEAHVAG